MAGKMVEYKANGGTTSGYLAAPAPGHGPGVVVIQEWWGLVPHIKDIADRLASVGFVALAPDLYHGKTTTSPDEAGKLMMAMRIDEAEKDLRGAVDYLLSLDAVQPKKVGAVGFCMGGALSLYAASKNPKVSAAVVYYGGHPNVHPDLENLQASVLGHYAERDGFVTVQLVRELDQKLTALKKPHTFHIYPGVDHAFFNDTRPTVYNKTAAQESWRRTLDFFHQHLR